MGRVILIIIALAVIAGGVIINLQTAKPQATVIPTPEPTSEPANSRLLDMRGPLTTAGAEVAYFQTTNGYYAAPVDTGDYPGVVMMHEWWGLNDNIRAMADILASQGYRVLAVDLFSKVATTAQEAREQTAALDQKTALTNMEAAKAYLVDQGAQKIASLGWCFGGGQSLQMALSDPKLSATVIYYGQPATDEAKLKHISWPILGIFGEEDQSIPIKNAREFQEALDKAGVENEFYFYPGVGHAFANPSGASYAPAETKDAWAKTLDFLNKYLKGGMSGVEESLSEEGNGQ